MVVAFTYTDKDIRKGADALLEQQRPGTTWVDLSEGERGNLEADIEAVLNAVGGTWAERGSK